MDSLKGKKGVVLGVGNKRSIAWAIAEELASQGAEVALTYLPEPKARFEKCVRQLAENIGCTIIEPCDVSDDQSIDNMAASLSKNFYNLDFMVHSLAFANHDDLKGSFLNTSRAGYLEALNISAFSLITLCSKLEALLKNSSSASVITLSFIGSQIAVPHYNLMGPAKAALESNVRYLAKELGEHNIRVNALSAGAVRTLSAAGISGFNTMLDKTANSSALKRTITQAEIAKSAAFLLSDNASAISGQTIYVDGGFSTCTSE